MPEGIVTLANMRISAVDGTAFVDFGVAGVLTDNVGRLLKIYDSSRRAITGRIYAAGTAETYTELITDPTFDVAGSWTPGLGWSVAGGKAVAASASNTSILQSNTYVLSALYKYVLVCDALTQGSTAILINGSVESAIILGTTTRYYTATVNGARNTGIYAYAADGGAIGTFTDISCQKVLTPGSTGVLIVSEDMATRNWTSKNTSFNYNDASGYTYDFEQEPGIGGIGRGRLYAYMHRR